MSDIEERLRRLEEQVETLEVRSNFRFDANGNDVPRVKKIRGLRIECTGKVTKVKFTKGFNNIDEYLVDIKSVEQISGETITERRIKKISGSEFHIYSSDDQDSNLVNIGITELPKGR